MFPDCGCIRFVFVFFFFRFIWVFMYNLMISWNPFAHPSLSLVISYNEDGCNEDVVRQLLYAPDFEDTWLKLFCLAKSSLKSYQDRSKWILFYGTHEPVPSSSWKVNFLLFCFFKLVQVLRFTIKMSKLIFHTCLFVCMFVLQYREAGLCGSKPWQNHRHADEAATQPGGHRNAKSTSKHTPGPCSPFTRQIQTYTHTTAHLLLSSHRGRSFHVSNFKRTLTHRRTQTSISSSCDKSEKSAAVWGCVRSAGEGGQIVSGKKQWRFSPLVNDFPFMKLRVGCISIQPRWSLHDSIGKWPAVIKQCGGKNTEEYSREKLTFFTVLNFTRVNKSPKERRIKSTPQPPQFSKTPGPGERLTRLFWVCGMARWLTEYEESWHLLKFLMQCCLLLLLKSKWHQQHVREREEEEEKVERRKRQTKRKIGVLFNRSGV